MKARKSARGNTSSRADSDPRLAQIEVAYCLNYAQFLHVASAITGDAELAADAVQDAFVRAIARRHTYREAGPMEGWLWRIVVNAARSVTSRRREVAESDPSEPEKSSSPQAADAIRAAIAALPERQRLVLFLRYFADLDYLTIGEAVGVRPGTVGATLHSAHDALRRQIEEVQCG